MKPDVYARHVTGDKADSLLPYFAIIAVIVLALMFLMDEMGYRRGQRVELQSCTQRTLNGR